MAQVPCNYCNYISPILTYLFGSVPCIFTLRYLGMMVVKNPLMISYGIGGGVGIPFNSHAKTAGQLVSKTSVFQTPAVPPLFSQNFKIPDWAIRTENNATPFGVQNDFGRFHQKSFHNPQSCKSYISYIQLSKQIDYIISLLSKSTYHDLPSVSWPQVVCWPSNSQSVVSVD